MINSHSELSTLQIMLNKENIVLIIIGIHIPSIISSDLFKTWVRFRGRDEANSDESIEYSIRNIPKTRFAEALNLMSQYYLRDEPQSAHLGNDIFF